MKKRVFLSNFYVKFLEAKKLKGSPVFNFFQTIVNRKEYVVFSIPKLMLKAVFKENSVGRYFIHFMGYFDIIWSARFYLRKMDKT